MITWDETRARLRADRMRLEHHLATLPGTKPGSLWLYPSYQSVLLHRLSFFFCSRGSRLLGRFFWHLNLMLTACDIGPLTDVDGGLLIHSPLSVALFGKIGRNCTIQGHVVVGGGTHRFSNIGAGPGLPVIGNDVALGWGSIVVGPVRVGERVVVGHGVVVTNNVPDDTVIPNLEVVTLKTRASRSGGRHGSWTSEGDAHLDKAGRAG